MNQVYIVTQSITSDGRDSTDILGVFTTKKLAELFINSYSKIPGSSMEINTQTINPFKVQLKQGLKYYFLRMTTEGKADDIELCPYTPQEETVPYSNHVSFGLDNILLCYCFAKDEKDAIRICNEERMKILDENKWPKPGPTKFST